MIHTTLSALPPDFVTTRQGLHALAEHVIAPLRHREEGSIGLRATPQGFGTEMLPGDRQVRVIDGYLVDTEPGEPERRSAITTLGAAGAFLGVRVGADPHIYAPVTDPDPERDLRVDRTAAVVLGTWFTWGAEVLEAVRRSAGPQDTPSVVQLWPEHFDLALDLGPAPARVNVGVSPGDAEHPEPYLYVGPWTLPPKEGGPWNEIWGASLPYQAVLRGADPLVFVADARRAAA